MGLTKDEQIQLTELAAKAKNLTPEKYVEEMAKEYGIETTTITAKTRRQDTRDPNTRFIEKLLESGEKGELSIDAMVDKLMKFSMMKMMAGGGMFGGETKSRQDDAIEMVKANDEKWERRLAQDKTDRKEEDLNRRLDSLERLLADGGGKKNDAVLDEIKETRKELAAEKEKRHEDAMDAKEDKIIALKDYIDTSLEDIRNRDPPKDPADVFFDMADRMEKFNKTVKVMGKSLGMTDEQIEKEVADALPMKRQIWNDSVKILKHGIDAWAGKKADDEEPEEPEVAEEPEKETAAEKAARKKSEIPTEPEPAPVPEEVLTIS